MSHINEEESSLKEDVRLLKKDMWFGNGLPGLTTRMKTVEDRVGNLEKYNTNRDSNLNTRMNLIIASLLTLAGAIILQLIYTKH